MAAQAGPPGEGEYSVGELGRRLADITGRLEGLATRMETTYVRFDLFEASKQLSETERAQLDSRISKLEARSEWLIRTVGAMIIAALLGLVVTVSRAKTGV